MHRNRNPCNSFLMVKMDRGRMRLTTTSRNMAALLRLIPSLAALVYSVCLWYWTSMLWSIDTCQNKVSADQCRDHITGSGLELIEVLCFFKVDCWPSTGFFDWIPGPCLINLKRSGPRVDQSMNFLLMYANVFHRFWVMGSWCSLTLFEIKTEGQSSYIHGKP